MLSGAKTLVWQYPHHAAFRPDSEDEQKRPVYKSCSTMEVEYYRLCLTELSQPGGNESLQGKSEHVHNHQRPAGKPT